jgi:hypothetical protein
VGQCILGRLEVIVISGLGLLFSALFIFTLVQQTVYAVETSSLDSKITLVFTNIADASGESSREAILESGMKNIGNTFMLCLMEKLQATNKFNVFTESEYESSIAQSDVNSYISENPSGKEPLVFIVDGAITSVNHVIKKNSLIDPETFSALVLKKEFITLSAVISLSEPSSGETVFSQDIQGEAKITKVTAVMKSKNASGETEITDERVTDLYKAMEFASVDFINFLFATYPLEGEIVEIVKRGKIAIIDIGDAKGVSVGDKFDVIEVRYRVVDGEIVGDEEVCGECIVESVIDDTHCQVKKVSGAMSIDFIVRYHGIRD